MNILNGRCRYCKAAVKLMSGQWKHDGIATLIHFIKYGREGLAAQDHLALAGPFKGSAQ